MGRVSILKQSPERPSRWTEFTQHVVQLITEALFLLRERNNLIKDEREVNRLLYQCIIEVNYNLGIDFLPAFDAKNPPHLVDKQKAKREDSIPDFYWPIMDHTASYEHWHRNYVLECKLLGKPTSSSWVLTREYVKDGILRFFLEEKGYGKGCETGAMAGYVQDQGMEFDTILDEVNSYIAKHEPTIPALAIPANGWQTQGVSYLKHTFRRSFIPLSFSLQHFWVDMRDCQFLADSTNTVDSSAEQQHQSSHRKNNKKTAFKQKPSPKVSTQKPYQLVLPADQGQETF